jgi:hypothetical protein
VKWLWIVTIANAAATGFLVLFIYAVLLALGAFAAYVTTWPLFVFLPISLTLSLVGLSLARKTRTASARWIGYFLNGCMFAIPALVILYLGTQFLTATRIRGKLELAGGPGGRCRRLGRKLEFAGGGKSELRRAVCRITSGTWASKPMDGQCHRKDTASATPPGFFGRGWRASLETQYPSWPATGYARRCVNSSAGVRVKWCGKSAPLRR